MEPVADFEDPVGRYDTEGSSDTFGLEFAISQWLKLVINAENLFSKLVTSKCLTDDERNQIERWLCLKQECEECVGSNDIPSPRGYEARILERIDELTESDINTEKSVDLGRQTSSYDTVNEAETESDIEQNPDFLEKLDGYIEKFKHRTDNKVNKRKDALLVTCTPKKENISSDFVVEQRKGGEECKHWVHSPFAVHPMMTKSNFSRRRKSIHPGVAIPNIAHQLDSLEEHYEASVCQESQRIPRRDDNTESKHDEDKACSPDGGMPPSSFVVQPSNIKPPRSEPYEELKMLSAGNEAKQSQMRQVLIDLEGAQKRIEELHCTIQLKEQLIQDLIKNSEMRASAKQRFRRKRSKLEGEYYKTCSQIAQAEHALMLTDDNDFSGEKERQRKEIEKYRSVAEHYEKRLKDIEMMKHIAGNSARKVLELESSLQKSRCQMEKLKEQLRKEENYKHVLEQELLEDQCKIRELEQKYNIQSSKLQENSLNSAMEETRLKWIQEEEERIANMRESSQRFQEQLLQKQSALEKREAFLKQRLCSEKKKAKSISEVSARICHLNQILKEKSTDLENTELLDEKEALRHEIGNLRRTRDCLVDQRCGLDEKFQKDKILSTMDERKLIEYEEAIEAIDTAIEYKNELICGRNDEKLDNSQIPREKGEELLLARLMKLSPVEMRSLLYKYFQKVIDLRESGRRMEKQLIELDVQNEAQKWKVQTLSNALQQAHLEAERHIVMLQKEHEDKMHLMLRQFAEESSGSSGTEAARHTLLGKNIELNKCRRENKNLKRRIKELETQVKFPSKAHGRSRSVSPVLIPQQNLKKLQGPGSPSTTKVTLKKNKLIIQQQKA
ncbi:kinesin-like protein costa [Anabrus simplex]|uniref:kinesin-like protein costa n=1 Tax=Anabrus simplex TaxID=316456 RepID=UPI0035A34DCB